MIGGFTLVELLVTLTLLAVILAVAAVSIPHRPNASIAQTREARIREAIVAAQNAGQPRQASTPADSSPRLILALPDGRVAISDRLPARIQ